MTNEQLVEAKENFRKLNKRRYYKLAVDIVSELLDEIENNLDYYSKFLKETTYDFVEEYVRDTFIIYKDAFDFLKNNKITDFSDAVEKGYGDDVYLVAHYYVQQNVYSILKEIGLMDLFED